MKNLFISLSCFTMVCLSAPLIRAQKIHEIKEIIEIMDKSKLSYSMEVAESGVSQEEEKRVLIPYWYKTVNDSGETQIGKLEYEGEALKESDLAEKAFVSGKLDEARSHYERLIELNPDDFLAMTYLGQTYEKTNRAKAEEWYRKAIENNWFSYMAHWFLADAYLLDGKKTDALKEISIAWVLNRNNQNVKKALITIMEANGKKFDDWQFEPGCYLLKEGKTINMRFVEEWGPYAMVKAVWMYEPGFLEELGYDEVSCIYAREREAVINTLLFLKGSKSKLLKKDPVFKAMDRAFDEDLLDIYVVFEAAMPLHPLLGLMQKPETVEAIAEYAVRFHTAQ